MLFDVAFFIVAFAIMGISYYFLFGMKKTPKPVAPVA
jgi:ABC-type multidrug transport system permease subunit